MEKTRIQEYASNWISRTSTECPGYQDTVREIIHTLVVSAFSHDKLKAALAGSKQPSSVDTQSVFRSKIAQVHGVLIHGFTGTGKTKLVQCLTRNSGWDYTWLDASDVYDAEIGGSERKLKSIFETTMFTEPSTSIPVRGSLIVIDQLDALVPDRQKTHNIGLVEKHIVSEMISYFGKLEQLSTKYVCVIGITNRVAKLDSALRREGRFEREYELNVPSPISRTMILSHLLESIPVLSNKDELITELSERTHGFVAADLFNLVQQTSLRCLSESMTANSNKMQQLSKDDFLLTLSTLSPSVLSNVAGYHSKPTQNTATSSLSHVTFGVLAGIDPIVHQLRVSIVRALSHRAEFERIGIAPPRGLLIYGPPGVGKTLLARALANEARANFISVQGTDIVSKIVGESSRAVSSLFQQARASSPCILFIDQFEALARARGNDSSESQAADRLLSTLLTEMDGIANTAHQHVIVVGATNRVDMLDGSILRPGRMDLHIHVPLPDYESRLAILILKTKEMPLERDANNSEVTWLQYIARTTEGCSGADLENLCREAAMCCLREDINSSLVSKRHFDAALRVTLGEKYSEKEMEPAY